MLPYLTEHHGNPSSIHASGDARGRASTRRARRSRPRIGAKAARDRLHRRRHRGRQPRRQGRRVGGERAGPPRRHQRRRAQGRAQQLRRSSSARASRSPTCRWTDTAASIRPTLPRRITDRTTLVSIMAANNEVGTAPADGRDRRHLPRAQGAASTSTRCSPPRSRRRRRTPGRRPASASRRTSSAGRRGSARCTCARGRRCCRSSRADPRSGSAGPGPRTSPGSSASRAAVRTGRTERADGRRSRSGIGCIGRPDSRSTA